MFHFPYPLTVVIVGVMEESANTPTTAPPTVSPDLISRLLDQNEKLIDLLGEAVRGANPVGIIAALNPPFPTPPTTPQPRDTWENDEPPHPPTLDPWADDNIPFEEIVPGGGRWVDVPGLVPVAAQEATGDGGGDDGEGPTPGE